jgi:hypothetical protein
VFCNTNGTISMEREIRLLDLFKTKIHNKKILLLEPNCDLQNPGFCGLNFFETTDCSTLTNVTNIESFKNTHWDYIICHVFHIRNMRKSNASLFEKYNITCDTLVLDEVGEGFSISHDAYRVFEEQEFHKKVKAKNVKWLSPFYDYSDIQALYPNVEFFSEQFTTPLLFGGKTNHMIHGGLKEVNGKIERCDSFDYANHIVAGLKWRPEEKEKLFMSLNNDERRHRTLLIHYLTEENLLEKGYVSYLKPPSETFLEFENVPYIENLNVKRYTLPWEDGNELNRFGIQEYAAKSTYIDVVTESSTGHWPFKTEKCLKPFYNLQFPIILGHHGIVQDLRDIGFDLFDDIINHEYDRNDHPKHKITINQELEKDGWNDNLRIPRLIDELKRLSTIDIKKIYEDNKERFIKNQELVWKLTIENNDILYKLGDFVFGNDIEYFDTPTEHLKKIYL